MSHATGVPVTLPGDRRIHAPSAFEARVLFQEIFGARAYFRHHIALPPGSCVLDVGANIGMFGLYLAEHHPDATVHMLEPVPSTFAILERNIAPLAGRGTLHPHRLGLSDRNAKVNVEVDPRATFAASMRQGDVEASRLKSASRQEWAEAALRDLARIFPGNRAAAWAARLPDHPWARGIALRVIAAAIEADERARDDRIRREPAEVVRLSDFLRAQGIERVDLVKIDVEGSEMDVLNGVDEADWPRLRQLVVEVHDAGGRADRMAGMLAERGYETTLEPEEWALHRLLGITTLFARRAERPA